MKNQLVEFWFTSVWNFNFDVIGYFNEFRRFFINYSYSEKNPQVIIVGLIKYYWTNIVIRLMIMLSLKSNKIDNINKITVFNFMDMNLYIFFFNHD